MLRTLLNEIGMGIQWYSSNLWHILRKTLWWQNKYVPWGIFYDLCMEQEHFRHNKNSLWHLNDQSKMLYSVWQHCWSIAKCVVIKKKY